MKQNLAEKMINDSGLGKTKKQKNKKIRKSSETKKKEPRSLVHKKRFIGGQRKGRKNNKEVDGIDGFQRNKDSIFSKLPEESKASSEFSRFKSMIDETVVIESDKSSKIRKLKRPCDSAQSSEITQNNEQTKEEKQIDTSSKVENSFNIYKFSTFATKQQYDSHANKKGEKRTDYNIVDSSILERDSEIESFE